MVRSYCRLGSAFWVQNDGDYCCEMDGWWVTCGKVGCIGRDIVREMVSVVK